MKLPLAGPSYKMRSRAAGVDRTVNMYPVRLESGVERSQLALRDIPGLAQRWDFSSSGPIRGEYTHNGRSFAVAGNTLYERFADFTSTARGTIGGSGLVGMASNAVQLVIGTTGVLYVMELATNVLASHAQPCGPRVGVLDEFIFFIEPNTGRLWYSDAGDATAVDGLNTATAQAMPDNVVDFVIDHREILVSGSQTLEVYSLVGGTDVVARNNSAFIEYGIAAPFTAQKVAGAVVWPSPSGRVYRLDGYNAIPVSDDGIEAMLHGKEMSQATAYAIEHEGGAFYCLNVPGVSTTLVYDLKNGAWHERAELIDGEYQQHRAQTYSFAFGMHLAGASNGKCYELDPTKHTNAGDPLCRSRVFPTMATPSRERVPYGTFSLDCDRGYGGHAQLRYSNDGTEPAHAGRTASLGAVGVRESPVKWDRCGSARDRVWEVRCTDDVPFNPVSAEVD